MQECSPFVIEASHLRNMTGMGRKEPDDKAVPMCPSLHRDWEQHTGYFMRWTKEHRLEWFTARIAETQEVYRRETNQGDDR
jgi:hypothetical protein